MIAWIRRWYYRKVLGWDTAIQVEYPDIFKVGHEGSTSDRGKPFMVKAKIGDELWIDYIDRPTPYKVEPSPPEVKGSKEMPCRKGSKGKKQGPGRKGDKKGKKKGK